MPSVTVRGSAIKQAKCQKCHCDYVYEMFGQNTRHGDSMVYAGVAGGLVGAAIAAAAGGNSEEKLRSQAQANLERLLAKGCEPVPCPACGWYQPEMVKEAKRRYRKPMVGVGATLMVIGSALLLILMAMTSSPYSGNTVSPIAFVVAVGLALSGLGVLAWRWSMRRAYDINEGYPSPRPPYPGSPQGLDIKNLPKVAAISPAGAPGTIPGPPPPPTPASPPGAALDWYYTRGDRQAGPVAWAVLKDLAAGGVIGPRDLVFASGSSDWVEASEVPGLVPAGQDTERGSAM